MRPIPLIKGFGRRCFFGPPVVSLDRGKKRLSGALRRAGIRCAADRSGEDPGEDLAAARLGARRPWRGRGGAGLGGNSRRLRGLVGNRGHRALPHAPLTWPSMARSDCTDSGLARFRSVVVGARAARPCRRRAGGCRGAPASGRRNCACWSGRLARCNRSSGRPAHAGHARGAGCGRLRRAAEREREPRRLRLAAGQLTHAARRS